MLAFNGIVGGHQILMEEVIVPTGIDSLLFRIYRHRRGVQSSEYIEPITARKKNYSLHLRDQPVSWSNQMIVMRK